MCDISLCSTSRSSRLYGNVGRSPNTVSGRLFVMVFVQVEIHRQLAEVDKALVFLRKGRCGCAAVL